MGSATPTATTATPPNQHKHQHHQHHQQQTNNTTNTNNTNKAKKTREHQKTEKKTQNYPKIGPGEVRKPPKMEAKSEKKRFTAQNGTRWGPRVSLPNVTHPFWTILGSPLVPQNRPKIDLWRKRRSQRRFQKRSLPILLAISVFV